MCVCIGSQRTIQQSLLLNCNLEAVSWSKWPCVVRGSLVKTRVDSEQRPRLATCRLSTLAATTSGYPGSTNVWCANHPTANPNATQPITFCAAAATTRKCGLCCMLTCSDSTCVPRGTAGTLVNSSRERSNTPAAASKLGSTPATPALPCMSISLRGDDTGKLLPVLRRLVGLRDNEVAIVGAAAPAADTVFCCV